MSMLFVLPDIDAGVPPDLPVRICVLAQIPYESMTDGVMGWPGQIPVPLGLVVTKEQRVDNVLSSPGTSRRSSRCSLSI